MPSRTTPLSPVSDMSSRQDGAACSSSSNGGAAAASSARPTALAETRSTPASDSADPHQKIVDQKLLPDQQTAGAAASAETDHADPAPQQPGDDDQQRLSSLQSLLTKHKQPALMARERHSYTRQETLDVVRFAVSLPSEAARERAGSYVGWNKHARHPPSSHAGHFKGVIKPMLDYWLAQVAKDDAARANFAKAGEKGGYAGEKVGPGGTLYCQNSIEVSNKNGTPTKDSIVESFVGVFRAPRCTERSATAIRSS